MNLKAGSLFCPSLHSHYGTSSLLWLLLRVCPLGHPLSFVVTAFPLHDVLHLASASIRSPRRRCDNFPLVQPPNLLFRHVRQLGLLFVAQGRPGLQPHIRFLFVSPRFCPLVFPTSSFLQPLPHGNRLAFD